jgi:hypothetical protein
LFFNNILLIFALLIKKMEQYLFFQLIYLMKNFPLENPALVDILKLVIGSIVWIGGLAWFMYHREKNLKESPVNN